MYKRQVCGSDWTIREISPSEGYLLDSATYPVGAEASHYTVEYNSTSVDVDVYKRQGPFYNLVLCIDSSG